ncbi:hypothetical protein SKAU_G00144680 [Synaphobranchus kaupii]|uniref:Uncharacterized protein n=1 Tax=Synaphobranchus kaupii TaxID=118154 RepID=A0A9Q1FTY1_SYNKA|nr:hypothetical protein SKAU_G00144680 [Synaphobranchus kaupii]
MLFSGLAQAIAGPQSTGQGSKQGRQTGEEGSRLDLALPCLAYPVTPLLSPSGPGVSKVQNSPLKTGQGGAITHFREDGQMLSELAESVMNVTSAYVLKVSSSAGMTIT